ncbi:VOC family protein [Actinomadura rugatobispora]|uniref:VOC family protein n=1 Tax=Actinomadura rugatobispora TaxID=1994 RepID=A0ABW1AEY4_9ACTN|nr:VOC family protein [Actinomadura rugatobispora]
MPVRIANVTFDCENTLATARFWSAAFGRPLDPDPTEFFASIGLTEKDRDGTPSVFFILVPEKKTVKNRTHLDLDSGGDRETEIARLVGLGAKRGADHDEFGHSWTVMNDPEGNEFCIS